jgi:hypothetical protein
MLLESRSDTGRVSLWYRQSRVSRGMTWLHAPRMAQYVDVYEVPIKGDFVVDKDLYWSRLIILKVDPSGSHYSCFDQWETWLKSILFDRIDRGSPWRGQLVNRLVEGDRIQVGESNAGHSTWTRRCDSIWNSLSWVWLSGLGQSVRSVLLVGRTW